MPEIDFFFLKLPIQLELKHPNNKQNEPITNCSTCARRTRMS